MRTKFKVKKLTSMVTALVLILSVSLNTAYAAENQLYNNQTVDVTSLASGEAGSWSPIWVDEYDATHMWQRDTVSGNIRNKKEHDVLVKYTIAEKTCNPANKKITYSTECGYYKEEPWITETHEPKLDSNGKQYYTVNKYNYTYSNLCKNCGASYNEKPCVSENGVAISDSSPRGTKCVATGFVFDKYYRFLAPTVTSVIEVNNVKTEAIVTLTTTLPISSSDETIDWFFPPCLVTWWEGGNSNTLNRIDYSPFYTKIEGNKLVTKYKMQLRDYTKKYTGPIYMQEIRSINDGEYVYEMSGTYIGYVGFMQIPTDFTEPTITSTNFTSATTVDGWNGGTTLTIGGTIVGSYSGYITVTDGNEKIISPRKSFIINDDNSYSTSVQLTDIEQAGKNIKIKVEDYFGKSVESTVTTPNIDTKAPVLTNVSSISLNKGWAKEKQVTFELTDSGIGGVETAVNLESNYVKSVETATGEFKQSYTFTGDIYSPKNIIIFFKDKLGNYNTAIKPIDKIDNTPPTITEMSTNTSDLAQSVILTAYANDINKTLNQEGSGNLQYRFYSSNAEINKNNAFLNKWSTGNNVPIYENGTYYVEIKDLVENSIVSEPFKVKNIDSNPPKVDVSFSNSGDGKYKIVTVTAVEEATTTSKMSGLKQNEKGDLDCFSIVSADDNKPIDCAIASSETTTVETPTDEIILYKKAVAQFKTNENKKFVIRVQDNVLNSSLVTVTIDANDIGIIDGIDGENLETTNKYPEWTKGTVKLTAYINDPSYQYSWSWDYTGDLSEYQETKGSWFKGFYGTRNGIASSYHDFCVTENGTYQVVTVDEKGILYSRSTTVSNIDKEAPTCTVTTGDNSIIINASDKASGIDYIMVDGGSLATIQQIYCYGSKDVQVAAKISANSDYKITIYDKAGNISDTITKTISTIEPDSVYYTVTFCNYDGSIIKSELVKEEENATPPTTVTRQGYTFTGWDNTYSNIKQDTKITAQFYDGVSDEYFTVDFCTYDGSILKSQSVKRGESATPPSSVTRDGYIFTGWDKSYSNITGNVVTTAKFVENEASTDEYFTVTFCTYDSSIIKSEKVAKGGNATPPTSVTRDGYTFTGWDKIYSNVQGNVVTTAQFVKGTSDEYFTVVFCNYDDSVLKSESVKKGSNATPPTTVTREGYTFTGWDDGYSNIIKNTTITAQFSEGTSDKYYKVDFCNYDGSVVKSQKVKKGEDATPPTTVTREGYSFMGWDDGYSNITKDRTITAQFVITPSSEKKEATYYTVSFYNFDGSIIKSQTVEKGQDATPPTTVVRDGYTFSGWSNPYSNVQGDVKVVAMFKANVNQETKVQQKATTTTYASGSSTLPKSTTTTEKVKMEEKKEKEPEKKSVMLTEYTAKALPLSISDETLEGNSKEGNDKYQPSINLLQEEDIPSATKGMEKQGGLTGKQIGAIFMLVTIGAGAAFYFLNKKYYWVDLPF